MRIDQIAAGSCVAFIYTSFQCVTLTNLSMFLQTLHADVFVPPPASRAGGRLDAYLGSRLRSLCSLSNVVEEKTFGLLLCICWLAFGDCC